MAENIGIGDVGRIGEQRAILSALQTVNSRKQLSLDMMLTKERGVVDSVAKYDWRKANNFQEEIATDLSGGEEQSIKIARSAMRNDRAKLLILDEPDKNLDRDAIQSLVLWMRRQSEKGCIIVVISHNSEILTEANMRLELKDGRIVSHSIT